VRCAEYLLAAPEAVLRLEQYCTVSADTIVIDERNVSIMATDRAMML
jgi:hypothetical protein